MKNFKLWIIIAVAALMITCVIECRNRNKINFHNAPAVDTSSIEGLKEDTAGDKIDTASWITTQIK